MKRVWLLGMSSVIDAVKYRRKSERLDVIFHGGMVYAYLGVPFEVYEELLSQVSLGTYFNQVIKPNYDCRLPQEI